MRTSRTGSRSRHHGDASSARHRPFGIQIYGTAYRTQDSSRKQVLVRPLEYLMATATAL